MSENFEKPFNKNLDKLHAMSEDRADISSIIERCIRDACGSLEVPAKLTDSTVVFVQETLAHNSELTEMRDLMSLAENTTKQALSNLPLDETKRVHIGLQFQILLRNEITALRSTMKLND